MFKKKGEGETPKAEEITEIAPTETTPTTTQGAAANKFKAVAKAGMIWKPKKKEDTAEIQDIKPASPHT